MKTSIVYLVIGLLVINSLSAQVKIGDNPQNLDPASILELQSTNRVLVITRVTNAQMFAITPLVGAVVYNTDQDCLHYYNGTEWVNICEALDNSFTTSTRADSLQQINPQARDNTIAILESTNTDGSTNYNFEVNQITGANIVNTSINADSKLQDETVTRRKLAEDAVGLNNLADATNAGELFIYNGSAWNFVNRSDLLNTQLDSIVGNEVVDATDGTLIRSGNIALGAPYTLDVSEGGITAFEIATDAVTTDEIFNQTILEEDIADDAVTNAKLNANVVGAGLTQAADGSLEVNIGALSGDGTLTSPNSTLLIGGAPTNSLFEDVEIDINNNSIRSNMIVDGQVSTQDIADGVITNVKMADNSVGTAEIIDDSVDADKINGNVAGIGLAQAADGSLEVDNAAIEPDWANISNIPVDIADGDDDTQLSDAQVATAVNNGFPNLDTDVTDDFDGNWGSLVGVPADLLDGDDDTQLTDAQVATAVNNGFPNLDTDVTDDFDGNWGSLVGVPADLLDGDDVMTYTAGLGINISGTNEISTTNLAGEVTGPINATEIAAGVIDNANIAAGAAIDGSKIDPVFIGNVTSTGDFLDNQPPPDFVFQKYYQGFSDLKNDYIFKSLDEIEVFLKKNNHLPGVKSAYEIIDSGKYNLTESSLVHLEKIEELFLHTIEQEKKIETLQSDNQKLAKELDSLKKEMKEIKAMLKNSQN